MHVMLRSRAGCFLYVWPGNASMPKTEECVLGQLRYHLPTALEARALRAAAVAMDTRPEADVCKHSRILQTFMYDATRLASVDAGGTNTKPAE
jgi:hypothetical protein